MTSELLATDELDLSGSPKDVFDRYLFIHSKDHADAIFRHCFIQKWIAQIDPLPDNAPSQVLDAFGTRPLVMHSISHLDTIWKRKCASWFSVRKAVSQDVYFLQCGTDGPIKIGIAADTITRVSVLQTACPWKIRILAKYVGGGRALESALHKRFARSNTHGEWFLPTPELLQFIATECQPCQSN